MNPDLSQFREKLVRLQSAVNGALHYLDSGMPVFSTPEKYTLIGHETHDFAIGDFVVRDRFPEVQPTYFEKGPNP